MFLTLSSTWELIRLDLHHMSIDNSPRMTYIKPVMFTFGLLNYYKIIQNKTLWPMKYDESYRVIRI